MTHPFAKKVIAYFTLVFFASLSTSAYSAVASSSFLELLQPIKTQNESGKSRAAAQAKAKHGGKVLSVREMERDGQTIYKVKLLLDSGRIKIVTIKG